MGPSVDRVKGTGGGRGKTGLLFRLWVVLFNEFVFLVQFCNFGPYLGSEDTRGPLVSFFKKGLFCLVEVL